MHKSDKAVDDSSCTFTSALFLNKKFTFLLIDSEEIFLKMFVIKFSQNLMFQYAKILLILKFKSMQKFCCKSNKNPHYVKLLLYWYLHFRTKSKYVIAAQEDHFGVYVAACSIVRFTKNNLGRRYFQWCDGCDTQIRPICESHVCVCVYWMFSHCFFSQTQASTVTKQMCPTTPTVRGAATITSQGGKLCLRRPAATPTCPSIGSGPKAGPGLPSKWRPWLGHRHLRWIRHHRSNESRQG